MPWHFTVPIVSWSCINVLHAGALRVSPDQKVNP
jgi:hypothetical protein